MKIYTAITVRFQFSFLGGGLWRKGPSGETRLPSSRRRGPVALGQPRSRPAATAAAAGPSPRRLRRMTHSNPAPPRAACVALSGRNSIGPAPHAPPPAGQWAAAFLHMQQAPAWGAHPGRFGSTDAGVPAPGRALQLSPRPGRDEAATADGAADGRLLAVRPRRLRHGSRRRRRDLRALGAQPGLRGPEAAGTGAPASR